VIADRYTPLRELGRGASGAVWLARDEVLGRQVAMKRQMRAGDDPLAEARAWREARVAARVRHPHLVAVYDLVEDGDDLWLVMEYVDGPTLARLVSEQGPLEPDRAAAIVAGVAGGLALAHEEGVVHRDVKPSNILLGADGEAKLADFGIARAADSGTLTETGMVHGSPAYLAPEVATGRGAGPASDVWALGATLFHLLEGRPPYTDPDDNVVGILYRIVHEPVPRTARGGWLGPLLVGTMTRDPERRWSLAQVQAFLAAGPHGGRVGGAGSDVPGPPRVPPPVTPPSGLLGPGGAEPRTAVLTAERPAVRTGAPAPPGRSGHPGPPGSPGSPGGTSPFRRPGTWLVALAGCVLAALVVALAVHLASGSSGPSGTRTTAGTTAGDSSTPGTTSATPGSGGSAHASVTPSTRPSGTPTTTSSPTASGPSGPTVAGVRGFVASYLDQAPASPASGFRMLTARYQAQSGGLPGYESFWGEVSRIHSVSPVAVRLHPLQATYTYSYTRRHHGRVTETVTLRLVYRGGHYLIAGAASA
jgi:eukaryotic-like serine/threonine-protein kinase